MKVQSHPRAAAVLSAVSCSHNAPALGPVRLFWGDPLSRCCLHVGEGHPVRQWCRACLSCEGAPPGVDGSPQLLQGLGGSHCSGVVAGAPGSPAHLPCEASCTQNLCARSPLPPIWSWEGSSLLSGAPAPLWGSPACSVWTGASCWGASSRDVRCSLCWGPGSGGRGGMHRAGPRRRASLSWESRGRCHEEGQGLQRSAGTRETPMAPGCLGVEGRLWNSSRRQGEPWKASWRGSDLAGLLSR